MTGAAFAFRRERTEDPDGRTWLLDRGGEVLGGCRTRPVTDDDADLGPRAAEVLDLALTPGVIGAGLGTRLLGQAVNDLLVRGRAPIFVWVPEGAGTITGFYARHGFRDDGARRRGRMRLVRYR